MMTRLPQITLILATLLSCWLGMQAVHELGHVMGAVMTGGKVARVELPLLGFSRTEIASAPWPLVTVWGGPLVGVVLPVIFWGVAVAAKVSGAFLLRFFAGFCLIGNGLYISLGSFERIGDCHVMLQYGSPLWQLILFGVFTVPAGFYLWHRQGKHFGFGDANGRVDRKMVAVAGLACVVLIALSLVAGQLRFAR